MVLEPYFYVIAVVSVFLHGMGKGGFIGAGSFGSLLAIPMLSIFIPPFQAVAILLLPLIFMDLVTVWRYRWMWDLKILKFIVPLAFLGIIFGTLSFSYLSEDSIRVIIGIMAVTLMSIFLGLVKFEGVFALPPDISPVFLKLDIIGALDITMLSIIMSFLFVNLFDTAGTLFGVASRAGLISDSGKIKNLDKALKADSSSSIFGSFLGCAPVTSYVESSAGIEAGGRTGITAIVVGLLFLLATFLSPLAAAVPAYATAGALIYVAILMLSGMEKLNWNDQSQLLPALVMIVMIPLTFSIANGIALGFLAYVAIQTFIGQIKQISSGAWFLTLIFVAKFIFL